MITCCFAVNMNTSLYSYLSSLADQEDITCSFLYPPTHEVERITIFLHTEGIQENTSSFLYLSSETHQEEFLSHAHSYILLLIRKREFQSFCIQKEYKFSFISFFHNSPRKHHMFILNLLIRKRIELLLYRRNSNLSSYLSWPSKRILIFLCLLIRENCLIILYRRNTSSFSYLFSHAHSYILIRERELHHFFIYRRNTSSFSYISSPTQEEIIFSFLYPPIHQEEIITEVP